MMVIKLFYVKMLTFALHNGRRDCEWWASGGLENFQNRNTFIVDYIISHPNSYLIVWYYYFFYCI